MTYHNIYPTYPPKPQRRPWRFAVPRLVKRLVLLLLLSPVLGLVFLYATSRSVRDAVGATARGELSPAVAFPGHTRADLLILGRDRDIDNRKRVLNTRGRSDLIMLTRMDFENRAGYILSIPRDTW